MIFGQKIFGVKFFFLGLSRFLTLGGRESNRTLLMGALFDAPYRAIAKTGLRPVLTIRPPTP